MEWIIENEIAVFFWIGIIVGVIATFSAIAIFKKTKN